MATVYYDKDADLKVLKGKKIAVIGYGAQGNAQALNLRDSGLEVAVAELKGTANHDHAVEDGWKPVSAAQAADGADLVQMLVPDTIQARVGKEEVGPKTKEGAALMFSHGFNIHFGQIEPPPGLDVVMVAPKGPGTLVRGEYEKGAGVPVLVAVEQDASGNALKVALSYAKAIGGTRAGAILTSFKEETETDLFGEQVVLCGGVSELVRAGFETLVEAGYQPEIAYFECMHELKLIVDLFYVGGLSWMRHVVSNTAEYGDFSRGKRIITPGTREEMKRILKGVRSGEFAREWILENRAGLPVLKAARKEARTCLLEEVGRKLRKMMSWIDAKEP